MKKIIAAAIVVALLLAAPWWMGGVAQKRVDKAFAELPKDAPYLKVVENKWTRGWLHSEHQTTLELVLPPQFGVVVPASKPVRFSMRDEVLHGPVLGSSGLGLARLDSKLVFSEEISRKLTDVLGAEAALKVITKMGFFSGTVTTVSGKGRSLALDKLDANSSGTISWDDFKFVVGIAPHFDSYDLDGKLPRIEVQDSKSGTHLLVSDVTLKGGGKRLAGELYDGGATFGIGKFKLDAANKSTVEITAMEYGYSAAAKDGFLQYAVNMGSGAVRARELEAIGIELQEVHFDVALRHLHMDTMQKLLADLREANVKVYQPGLVEPQSTLMQPLQKHGVELLMHDPELAFERIGFVTPQGAAWIKGWARLEGITDADVSAGGMQFLEKLVADFTIEIPQALVDKIPDGAQMVASLIEPGYLKSEGGKLTSHIEYRKGALLVNGKAPQLPPGMQLPGMAPAPPAAPPAAPAAPRK
jgi:uncharacterized protein YdgA (DUF945 family)